MSAYSNTGAQQDQSSLSHASAPTTLGLLPFHVPFLNDINRSHTVQGHFAQGVQLFRLRATFSIRTKVRTIVTIVLDRSLRRVLKKMASLVRFPEVCEETIAGCVTLCRAISDIFPGASRKI